MLLMAGMKAGALLLGEQVDGLDIAAVAIALAGVVLIVSGGRSGRNGE